MNTSKTDSKLTQSLRRAKNQKTSTDETTKNVKKIDDKPLARSKKNISKLKPVTFTERVWPD